MKQIITTTTNDALVSAHIAAITAKTGSVLMGTSKALLIEEAKLSVPRRRVNLA